MSAEDHPGDRPRERSAESSPAEVVRSVLAAARSLTLTTEGYRLDLAGPHSLEVPGRLLLNLPAESHLATEIHATPECDLAATVEFTDVAPVAVPERVRARVHLAGRLETAEGGTGTYAVCFTTVTAALERAGHVVNVGPDELAGADPDPLAETEAEILTHLAGAHAETVELLAKLVEPRLLQGVTRVDPLRLDRYGIVLRLRRSSGLRDVRLRFPVPLRGPADGVLQLRTLLARARACPRRTCG